MSKLLKLFAIFLLVVNVRATLCGAQAYAQQAQEGDLRSTLSPADIPYQPKFDVFPAAVGEMVGPLQRALTIKGPLNDDAKAQLRLVVEKGNSLLQSINRGYYDEVYHLLGIAHELLGETDKALEAYKSSLKFKTNDPAVLFRHAYLLRRTHHCTEAAPELREVAWLSHDYEAPVLFLESECLLELGNTEQALSTLEKAQASNPAFLPAAQRLLEMKMLILKKTSDPHDQAVLRDKIYGTASSIIDHDPNNRQVSLLLAHFLVERSDPFFDSAGLKKAAQLAQKFVDSSQYQDDEAVKTLVEVYLKQREVDEAEKILHKAIEKNPESKLLAAEFEQLAIEKKAQLQAVESSESPTPKAADGDTTTPANEST